MANFGLLNKVMASSPHVEMIVRRLYRNPIAGEFLRIRLKKKIRKPKGKVKTFDFSLISDHLRKIGVKEGDVLIIHSAYSPLKGSGLKPDEVVGELLKIVGPTGTLAMPVIRKYAESPPESEALSADISNILFRYDVHKSKVWTGIIPRMLMNRKDAVISRFPINTLAAIGPHADDMMKNNLQGDLPTANGIDSSWKYCSDQNAWVVSLGIDLTHSLTMIHTAEDLKKDKWPVRNWYREKRFVIKDKEFEIEKVVLERRPIWGMMHFGERALAKDLEKHKVMKSSLVEGVLIESLRSKDLLDFLNSRNGKGYPYFWVKGYLQ